MSLCNKNTKKTELFYQRFARIDSKYTGVDAQQANLNASLKNLKN